MAAIGAGAVMAAGSMFLTRPFAAVSWTAAPPHDASIYTSGEEAPPVVSPFRIDIEPMESLLLVNFEQDPDEVYVGLEPQAFDDEVHGTGLLVIGWRVDGRVDVFRDPALRLEPEGYGIAGAGLHEMVERSFAGATFEVGPTGAEVDISFQDLLGREITIFIREADTRPRHPFNLLAPMGGAATDPPALPLVYVNDFYFVRKAGTDVRIEIDGRAHQSDPIPLILDGTRVHFLRYSADPLIATLNPQSAATAAVLPIGALQGDRRVEAEVDGIRYELVPSGQLLEIRRMVREDGKRHVAIDFEPAFPHILALRDGAEVGGRFRITTEPQAGTVVGTWTVARSGQQLNLQLVPDGGWTPGDAPRMARVLFRTVKMFRHWPTTYRWNGSMQLPNGSERPGDQIPLTSRWERIE